MKKRGIKRERIIRVLLNNPAGNLTKYRVAKEAECSYPWVHEFLKKIEKRGWSSGTTVKDFAGLLNYWRRIRIKPKKKDYMHKNPLNLLRNSKLEYALTTYQAENIIQHYLFPTRTDVYIREEDAEKWNQLITQKGLVGKGNFRVLLEDDHVFYASVEKQELKLVSCPQLIVDLFDQGGVCVEAAEMLLKRVKNHVIRY